MDGGKPFIALLEPVRSLDIVGSADQSVIIVGDGLSSSQSSLHNSPSVTIPFSPPPSHWRSHFRSASFCHTTPLRAH